MPQRPKTNPDQVTVLVFRDNLVARTFRVPLKWLSQLGMLITLCVIVALASAFFGLKYYRLAQRAAPARVQELENELAQVQTAYQALEAKAKNFSDTEITEVAPEPAAQVPTPDAVAASATTIPPRMGALFSALPPSALDGGGVPNPDTLPFRLEQPTARWRGNMLQVHFNIQYISKDGGNQQGRILILARGPKSIFGYPERIFQKAGSAYLLDAGHGEYFSVSRFREGKAEFGPFSNRSTIQDVEIFILNQKGKLLLNQILTPETGTAAAPVRASVPAVSGPPVPAPAAPAAPVAKPAVPAAPKPAPTAAGPAASNPAPATPAVPAAKTPAAVKAPATPKAAQPASPPAASDPNEYIEPGVDQ